MLDQIPTCLQAQKITRSMRAAGLVHITDTHSVWQPNVLNLFDKSLLGLSRIYLPPPYWWAQQ